MSIYILQQPPMPWGDYGSILLSGMASRSAPEQSLELERTGPFIPPISFPGVSTVVVTEALKRQLERSGLAGLAFRPVVKKRIVRLEWETWDRTAEDPVKYPAGGEPESYILGRKHVPALAEAMGDLWEICLQARAATERVWTGPLPWDVDIFVLRSTWDGSDWFLARGVGYVYVSERAKAWLEATVPEWVTFKHARVR
jgi:hypothetical protein